MSNLHYVYRLSSNKGSYLSERKFVAENFRAIVLILLDLRVQHTEKLVILYLLASVWDPKSSFNQSVFGSSIRVMYTEHSLCTLLSNIPRIGCQLAIHHLLIQDSNHFQVAIT